MTPNRGNRGIVFDGRRHVVVEYDGERWWPLGKHKPINVITACMFWPDAVYMTVGLEQDMQWERPAALEAKDAT